METINKEVFNFTQNNDFKLPTILWWGLILIDKTLL